MDIKTADVAMKNKKPVLYEGKQYGIKEMVIWYGIHNQRQCSLVLTNDNKHVYRVNINKCEVCHET